MKRRTAHNAPRPEIAATPQRAQHPEQLGDSARALEQILRQLDIAALLVDYAVL